MELLTDPCQSCKKQRTLSARNLCHQCYIRLGSARRRQKFEGSLVDFIIANVPGWVDKPRASRQVNKFDEPCAVCSVRTQAIKNRCLSCFYKERGQNRKDIADPSV